MISPYLTSKPKVPSKYKAGQFATVNNNGYICEGRIERTAFMRQHYLSIPSQWLYAIRLPDKSLVTFPEDKIIRTRDADEAKTLHVIEGGR